MSDAATITKAELSDALFDQVGLNKREAKDLIDSFFETVGQSLQSGVDVKISGFGNFQLREKSARPGRNPKTGKAVDVAAKAVPHFKPGKALRDAVNESIK